jgi:hypothetical protein
MRSQCLGNSVVPCVVRRVPAPAAAAQHGAGAGGPGKEGESFKCVLSHILSSNMAALTNKAIEESQSSEPSPRCAPWNDRDCWGWLDKLKRQPRQDESYASVADEVEHTLSEMAYLMWAVTCEVEMGGTKSPDEDRRFPALARRHLPGQPQQGTMSFRQLLTVIDGLNRARHMRDCEGIVYLLELQRGKYYVGFMYHVYDNAHQGAYPDHCYCYCYKNNPTGRTRPPCQPGSYRTQRALS